MVKLRTGVHERLCFYTKVRIYALLVLRERRARYRRARRVHDQNMRGREFGVLRLAASLFFSDRFATVEQLNAVAEIEYTKVSVELLHKLYCSTFRVYDFSNRWKRAREEAIK